MTIQDRENLYKDGLIIKIQFLIDNQGVDINVYKRTKDEYDGVYGINAGSTQNVPIIVRGIITGEMAIPTDSYSAGLLQEGYLYTTSTNIDVGDVVGLVRQDNKKRKFKIEQKEGIGYTKHIITRYKLSSLGS